MNDGGHGGRHLLRIAVTPQVAAHGHAAAAGLLMNFHGSTLPRGWQRTYPNLMTMEAVRGLEFVTFEQKNAEDEPTHAAMLPFA